MGFVFFLLCFFVVVGAKAMLKCVNVCTTVIKIKSCAHIKKHAKRQTISVWILNFAIQCRKGPHTQRDTHTTMNSVVCIRFVGRNSHGKWIIFLVNLSAIVQKLRAVCVCVRAWCKWFLWIHFNYSTFNVCSTMFEFEYSLKVFQTLA